MVGAGPRAIATSPDGQRADVGNGDNTLTFVDLGVGGVFGVLDLGAVWLDSVSSSDLAAY